MFSDIVIKMTAHITFGEEKLRGSKATIDPKHDTRDVKRVGFGTGGGRVMTIYPPMTKHFWWNR